jgi:hypothetical protein
MNLKDFIAGWKKGQKEYGQILGNIVNAILLTLVYIVGVGITSIFSKILNKHFLELKFEPSKNSYWEELNLTKQNLESYYRQF